MTVRMRSAMTFVGVAALSALVASALPGATYALWSAEMETTGVLTDAATVFAVNGAEASSADPTVGIPLGPVEAQTLLDDLELAIPVEVRALSQGNRGLRYTVSVPPAADGSLFAAADLAVFPVSDAAECTVAAALPDSPSTSATPVPAGYSDSDVAEVEFWCVRAHLDEIPDEGEFQTSTTITGTHALGELSDVTVWGFDVLTAFRAAAEPTREIAFTYETFR
ncbi:MAG: hypothetical protein EOO67_08610 [Microbacterium sp.]|nr:MAG: hypothetical protein EOO67_08610 [Microbacterium sp.]